MNPGAPQQGWRSLGLHYFKFNAVGALGIGVQLLALALLVDVLRFHYLAANLLSIGLISILNFLISDLWIFRMRKIARTPDEST
ncbi:MAG: GtrA family protein [Acidobacteria bacterium]|nr:GtrA family protein [Acidobacteriota bacterium]